MAASFYKTFTVSVRPEGQPRPRPRFRGRGYFVPETAFFAACCWAARIHRPPKPIEVPVRVDLDFCFPVPVRLPKWASQWHDRRPDTDNIIKGVLDAMTRAGWWKSDSIVALINANKRWARPTLKVGAVVKVWSLT